MYLTPRFTNLGGETPVPNSPRNNHVFIGPCNNETVLLTIENQPPTVDDAIFDLEKNSNDEAVIGK